MVQGKKNLFFPLNFQLLCNFVVAFKDDQAEEAVVEKADNRSCSHRKQVKTLVNTKTVTI